MFGGKRKGPTSDLHRHSQAKTSLWSQLFRKNHPADDDAPPVWGTLGFLGLSAPSKESRTNHVKIPRSITASPTLPELQEIICAPPPRPSHAPILARQYSAGPLFPLIPPPASDLTPPPASFPMPPPSHLTPPPPSSPTNTVSPPPPYPNSPAPDYTFVQAVASSPLPVKRPPRTGQTPPPRFATPVVPDDETWLPDVKLEAITITEIWQQVESKVVVYPDGDQQISDHISITGRRSVIRSRQSWYPARAGSSQSWYPRDDTPHHFSVGWIRNRRTGERFQKRSSSFFDQRASSVFEAVSFTVSDPSFRGPSRASAGAFEDEETQPQQRRSSTPADSHRPASPGSRRSWRGDTRRPISPPMHLGPDVVLYEEQIGERTTKLYSELMEIMQISLRELAPPTAKITEFEPEEISSEPPTKPRSQSRLSTKQSNVLDTFAAASAPASLEKVPEIVPDQPSPPRQNKGPRGPRPSPFLQKQKSWKRMFSNGPY